MLVFGIHRALGKVATAAFILKFVVSIFEQFSDCPIALVSDINSGENEVLHCVAQGVYHDNIKCGQANPFIAENSYSFDHVNLTGTNNTTDMSPERLTP